VYFVARGVLNEEPGPEGRVALKGADNLYAYDSVTGQLRFVADLCSGPDLSGLVSDTRCPSDLKPEGGIGGSGDDTKLFIPGHEVIPSGAQVNVCERASASECVGERETGRYLVFQSYGRLVRGDVDNARDVYRYDAQTGQLVRVSLGEGGADANGNCEDTPTDDGCDAEVAPHADPAFPGDVYQERDMGTRAISEDGSRIVFTSAAPLSLEATNGLVNVYEWHQSPEAGEGAVSLVSSGVSQTNDEHPVISSSGADIFFITSQGLVPQDTDGQNDIYDAHECSSAAPCFSSTPAEPQPCSGDACQGPLTNPAPLLVPGSVSQAPGGNFPAPVVAPVVTPKQRRVACKKGFVKKNAKCVRKKASRKAKKASRIAGADRRKSS
jgi:hypothetical protein